MKTNYSKSVTFDVTKLIQLNIDGEIVDLLMGK